MARQLSDDHKQALARGRQEGRAVRAYLAALEVEKQQGRRADRPTVEQRITDVQARIDEEPNPVKRVELIQRRLDLEEQLIALQDQPDMESLEAAFVASVAGYSERKGISYAAWREAGVPAAVLSRAGVKRTRRTS